MKGISRQFGAVQALDDVSLTVEQGEIHALVGENGAGKTTLMRILYGADRPNAGSIELFGQPVSFHSAAEGIRAGIGMVSQHYAIIPELSCLENLMLGAEPGMAIDLRAAKARAQMLAERMNFEFNWDALAESLSPAGAQKLEILKLLWRESKVMILDEPTAMLSPDDSDALFASLHQLADQGATIIVVTHRLPEVLDHCRRVTVLRGGKLIEARDVQGTSDADLAELIVGRAVDTTPRPSAPQREGVLLDIRDWTVLGHRGNKALDGVSLRVHEGELLGIAGVDGSGQRELFWALCGLLSARSGSATLAGSALDRLSPRQRLEIGLRLIPEDRHEEGVVDAWTLEENASLGLQRRPEFSSGLWVRTDGRRALAQAMAERFSTKHGGLNQPMASLSGGNQQRFVAARALEIAPKLILAFQPARGLDIEATRRVYQGIAARCEEGACAVVVSFDLDELLDHCDRVVAMCGGRLRVPPMGMERDRATIGRLMVGAGA